MFDTDDNSSAADGGRHEIEMIIRAYVVDFDPIAAYRKIKPNATSDVARRKTRKALGSVYGKRLMERIMRQRADKFELDAERIDRELAAIAFARLDHFVDIEVEEAYAEDSEEGDAPVKHTQITPKPIEEIDPFYLPALSQVKEGRDGVTISTHNKMTALEMLGRRYPQYRPTQAVQSEQTVYNFSMDYGNPEEIPDVDVRKQTSEDQSGEDQRTDSSSERPDGSGY